MAESNKSLLLIGASRGLGLPWPKNI